MKRVIKAGLDTKSLTIEQFESLLKSYKLNPVVNRQAVYGEYTDTKGHTIRIRFYVSNTTSKITLDSLLLDSKILDTEDLIRISQIVKSLQSDLQDTKVLGLYSTEDSELFSKKRNGTYIQVKDTTFVVYYSNHTWIARVDHFPCDNPGGITSFDIKYYNAGQGGYSFENITDPIKLPSKIELDLPSDPTVKDVRTAIENSSEVWNEIAQIKTWLKKNSPIYKHNIEEYYRANNWSAPKFLGTNGFVL